MSWEPRPDDGLVHHCADSIEWGPGAHDPEAIGRIAEAHRERTAAAEWDHAKDLTAVSPQALARPKLPVALFELTAAEIEAALCRLPMLDMPLRNFFAPGIYARELTIPAGTLLTGRRHLAEHICIVSAGEITVWEDGRPPEVVRAPYSIVGARGARRIGYAHEETVWTTVFRNPDELRDVDAILDLWTEEPPWPLGMLRDAGSPGAWNRLVAALDDPVPPATTFRQLL